MIKKIPTAAFVIGAAALVFCNSILAQTPDNREKLVLDRSKSSLRFSTNSPQAFDGFFRKISGELIKISHRFEESRINFKIVLDSVSLRPDQIMQAIFLQTALQYLKQKEVVFTSSSIRRQSDKRFLVEGRYLWLGKSKKASAPVELVNFSGNKARFKLLVAGQADVIDKSIAPIPLDGRADADFSFASVVSP